MIQIRISFFYKIEVLVVGYYLLIFPLYVKLSAFRHSSSTECFLKEKGHIFVNLNFLLLSDLVDDLVDDSFSLVFTEGLFALFMLQNFFKFAL